jgi:hypothetical protein
MLADADSPGNPVWQDEEGDWLTDFPPPEGFDGPEYGEWGEEDYCRGLTAREQAALLGRHDRDRAREEADRDAYFGFQA